MLHFAAPDLGLYHLLKSVFHNTSGKYDVLDIEFYYNKWSVCL